MLAKNVHIFSKFSGHHSLSLLFDDEMKLNKMVSENHQPLIDMITSWP